MQVQRRKLAILSETLINLFSRFIQSPLEAFLFSKVMYSLRKGEKTLRYSVERKNKGEVFVLSPLQGTHNQVNNHLLHM